MASTFDRIYAGRPKQGAVLNSTTDQDAAANRAAQAAAAMSPETQAAAPQPLSSQATKNAWNYVGAQMEAAQPRVQSQPTETQQPLSYADMFVRMNPYRQPTQEQLEQERKRYRRNAVFAAISDGLSALSNLYYTTKGAPNAYTGGSTLTGKMYERQKELQKERQANQEKWLNGYLRALEMDRTKDAAERNWQLQLKQLARQEAADKRAEEKNNLDMQLLQGKISEQEWKTRTAEVNARYADDLAKEKYNSQKALTSQRNASAAAAYARANGGSGGSGARNVQPYNVGGERFYLPSTFWNNNGQISSLYNRLPENVRDEAEGNYSPTGRRIKGKKLTNQQKAQVIMDNATPEIKNILREYSKDFGYPVQQQPGASAPWVGVQQNNNSNAPWVTNQ